MAQDVTGIEIPEASPADAPLVCVSLNPEWIPIVVGWLNGLMNPYEWELDSPTDNERIKGLVEGLVAQFVDALPCLESGELLRQNPENPCVLEQSADGVNWTTAFDFGLCGQQSQTTDYADEFATNQALNAALVARYFASEEGSFPLIPPTNYDGDGTPDYQTDLCHAIDSYVRAVARGHMIWAMLQGAIGTIAHTILEAILGKLGKMAINILGGWIVGEFAADVVALQDEIALRDVICGWSDFMQGKPYNFDTWHDVEAMGISTAGNRARILKILKFHNRLIGNYVVFIMGLEALQGSAAEGLTCNCGDNWCYFTDFADGAWDVWEATQTYPNNPVNAVGLLSSTAITPNAGNKHWVLIKLPETFDNADIMEVTYSSGYPLYFEIRDESRNRIGNAFLAGAGTLQTVQFELSGLTWFNWHLECFNASAHGGVQWTLRSVKFVGTGTNPLGTDNCP